MGVRTTRRNVSLLGDSLTITLLVPSLTLRTIVTSLVTHPTEQSTAPTLPAFLVDQDDKFFEFEGSIPRDCQPREGIEVKREESEILTIEVIRGEFERLDKGRSSNQSAPFFALTFETIS